MDVCVVFWCNVVDDIPVTIVVLGVSYLMLISAVVQGCNGLLHLIQGGQASVAYVGFGEERFLYIASEGFDTHIIVMYTVDQILSHLAGYSVSKSFCGDVVAACVVC